MEPMKHGLGMDREEAVRRLRAMGVEPEVVTACAPGTSREGGTLRVIRVRGNEITVSAFQDAIRE